jgi:ADP-heptose:LPS heptosyltransferase
MRFEQLQPLLEIPGIEFFSLQLGADAAAQLHGDPRVVDFTAEIGNFEDTAALVENLDLVICVDTSIAHLSGAIGKPVWLLNRFNTCWRWMMERTDSPWYPTMRIFRQPGAGDWESVVADVKRALQQKAAERPLQG